MHAHKLLNIRNDFKLFTTNQQKNLCKTYKFKFLFYVYVFIFVYHLPFIVCILSKIVGFDQLWTVIQQELVATNRNLVFFKMSNTFRWSVVQNCRNFFLGRISVRHGIRIKVRNRIRVESEIEF